MPQNTRIGDIGIGTCPCHIGVVSYVTTFITSSPDVDVDALGQIRIGDIGASTCGHSTVALTGSSLVDADGIPVHRIGDTGANCGPYVVVTGSPTTDSL